eukprot:TRINITY_DN66486_c0_g1_i1.p1 TRINITY_DN66486_c0_g1~~TRINITY_DN66486_c0_g1_i1.p1  ORF type:complete len:132 (-),score=11.15 TRINITY_DN66486_c0_g1_i1:114-509(-)
MVADEPDIIDIWRQLETWPTPDPVKTLICAVALLPAIGIATMYSSKAVLTRITPKTAWARDFEESLQVRKGHFKWSHHPEKNLCIDLSGGVKNETTPLQIYWCTSDPNNHNQDFSWDCKGDGKIRLLADTR